MWCILGVLPSRFYSKIDCLQNNSKLHVQLMLVCIWVCAVRGKGDWGWILYSYAVGGTPSPCSSLCSPVRGHGTHTPVPDSMQGDVGAGPSSASGASPLPF